jgi:large subunit ribosomal protein L19
MNKLSHLLEQFEKKQMKAKKIVPFHSGDTVRIFVRIREGEKERVQPFEGIVLNRSGRGSRGTFTLRRLSFGVGVERIFPLHSPWIERIEIVQKGKVRRSRVYYIRQLTGKAARIKSGTQEGVVSEPDEPEPLPSEETSESEAKGQIEAESGAPVS